MSYLEREDPEIYAAIEGERRRQVEKIERASCRERVFAVV